jgi:hypothetical protein
MTTPRQQAANRNNARASTGPKTAAGKARLKHNARRHGLASRNWFSGALAKQAHVLAHRIAGDNASAAVLTAARRVAEAQLDVNRVRTARHRLIAPALSSGGYWSQTHRSVPTRKMLAMMHGPATPEKFMFVLSDVARQLRALDRYEERALRRRRRACQDLDTIRVLEAVNDNGPNGS